ncbi:nuclear transport factor 2 family protein [Luteolibacter ambystomatis]|uniref:Nuclear transport factor 2 family protein n=1 Tax=Luteolibacter ambystomatis TaxID=2824561 RepID=A0A975G8X5_9BACT|nr:nuclear transport factor 2 family protein [Luteolibacter ambystomatis]QUE51138.1 nuclear transport factor 2 family protein [Luteolibacter ambystomatis]
MSISCPESLAAIVAHYEKLSLKKLDQLSDIYSPSVHFRDPIREANGLPALRGVYEDSLKSMDAWSMEVIDAQGDQHSGFLLWTLLYSFRGKDHSITGASHVKFASDGRISHQQDLWDASFVVYGEVPFLGSLMRFFHRRLKISSLAPDPGVYKQAGR